MPHSHSLVQIGLAAASAAAYGIALGAAPWKQWLLHRTHRQHAWGCAVAAVALLWALRVHAAPDVSMVALPVTALALMHGWALALAGAGFVIGADCALSGQWAHWASDLLCDVAVPACTIQLLHDVLSHRLSRNYVNYVFLTGFLGSAAAFALAGLMRLALPGDPIAPEHLVALGMMTCASASANGLLLSVAILSWPDCVASFDPDIYLR